LPTELSAPQLGAAAESAWCLIRSAAGLAPDLERDGRAAVFGANEQHLLHGVPADHPAAVLAWQPGSGWHTVLPADDPRSGLLSLYLPICSATLSRPVTIGHLGQSLDGFIATHSGDSQFVTGDDNMVHMHRLRALCDAVVVGSGTVAADDPQLTTRRVAGPNPIRVVVDPERRVDASARLFVDRAAPTLYMCGQSRVTPGETHVGAAAIVALDESDGGQTTAAQVLAVLHARGCARVFVEGGGVTVSTFLEANLLDWLQIAIAPVLIGDGRPAIRFAPADRLRDCRRPSYRVFRMGGDVLFDCDLRAPDAAAPSSTPGPITRVI
jgi:diaminohydroxyphosphoribosylaminopyrimidine deaminase / 5-amino-6-(5-phosphoribosylamino)uracil reductase